MNLNKRLTVSIAVYPNLNPGECGVWMIADVQMKPNDHDNVRKPIGIINSIK